MSKVSLEISPIPESLRTTTRNIISCLPFFKSRNSNAKYYHRVRSGHTHWHNGKLTHSSVSFWCGGNGYIGGKGRLYRDVQEDGALCATCEGRAIGAGLDGARLINGRFVMFEPRK